jgi:hypothetical protein
MDAQGCTAFVHLPHTFGLYQQSHRLKTGQPEPLSRNIRLMVDVLLTMNEAFRYAAGASFLFARPHHKRGSVDKCLVRKT